MLFERIRRTQKPIFVFLAVTFAMGFVLLGVGQGAGSINALDFLTGGTSSSDPTSSLKDQVTKNPKDAAAWQQLAAGLSEPGQERRCDQRLRVVPEHQEERRQRALGRVRPARDARLLRPAERLCLPGRRAVLPAQRRRHRPERVKATELTNPVASGRGQPVPGPRDQLQLPVEHRRAGRARLPLRRSRQAAPTTP